MLTVYTIAGGDMWRSAFNAVVAIIGTNAWDGLLKMVEGLAVLGIMYTFSSKRDPIIFLKWAALLTFITTVLLIPKRDIQIIDITEPQGIYQVDNVPAGLALISAMTTTIGHGFAQLFDAMLARPDSVSYSRTGMLFGSNLIERSQDITTQDPVLAEVLPKYMETCVLGDISISGKYSFQELMNSQDPFTLITRNPSRIRGIYSPNLTGGGLVFATCKEVVDRIIIPRMNLDSGVNGKTWIFYAKRWFGRKQNPNILMSSLLSNSYDYFYNGGKSASDIIKQNVMNSSLRQGISTLAGRSNDSANMINLATETASNKQRIGWATNMKMGAYWMPLMQSVLMLILVLSFPIIIVMAIVNHSMYGIKSIFNYIKAFVYFQTWPLMFAIINFCCTYYLKSDGITEVVLSNTDLIAQRHSDMMMVAGGMCMSVPILAYYLTKGTVDVISQVGGSLTSSMGSVASQQASTAADGNWSFNNMQMDNVNANKHDTNSVYKSGQYSQQQANGSMVTQTADGGMVYDTQGAMSKLASHLGISKQNSSAWSEQSKEAFSRAQNFAQGFNSNISSALNKLNQLASNRGVSDTLNNTVDESTAVSINKYASAAKSAVDAFAKENRISTQEAMGILESRSGTVAAGVNGAVSLYTRADADAGIKILGNGVGVHAGTEGKVSADASYRTDDVDTKNYRQDTTKANSVNNNKSAQYAKEYREAMDHLHRIQTANSGSHTQNEALSSVDQLSANLSNAQSEYKQYVDNATRSQDLAEMASYASNLSADQQQNLDQQFVRYIENAGVPNANELLTNTDSKVIASQRAELAESFMREEVLPIIHADYNYNKNGLGDSLPVVTNNTGVNVSEHNQQSAEAVAASGSGIPETGSVSSSVATLQSGAKNGMAKIEEQQTVIGNDIDSTRNKNEKLFNGKSNAAEHNIKNAKDEQSVISETDITKLMHTAKGKFKGVTNE